MDDNIKINEKDNSVEIGVESTIFDPKQVVVTANKFKDNSWIVMDTDSEGKILVKIIPKNDVDSEELRKIGLNFQTQLIASSIETLRNNLANR